MNEENIKMRIRALLREIQDEADPVLLNRCRSLFRKEVSFFRRSYMAAYLLLLAEEGGAGSRGRSTDRDKRRDGRPGDMGSRPGSRDKSRTPGRTPGRESDRCQLGRREERRDGKRGGREPARETREAREAPLETASLSEEEGAKLFISAGRNRRVFPRELLALISEKSGIGREDIGTIRTLDNYSFVQVRNTAADTVIAALNGSNFRGRTLTVNYARNRGEAETGRDDALGAPEAPDPSPAVSVE